MKLIFFLIPIFIVCSKNCQAQHPAEIKEAKALFEGAWLNKKTDRHITIFIEEDGYVTINDWTGRKKGASIDAYKAYITKKKLIMPADTDHHAPYSEILISGKTLVYLTESTGPNDEKLIEKELFVRSKW